MSRGHWIVYLNRYPDQTTAQAAAAHLAATGRPQAAAREIAPPGGV
jgi:hypothetical protein